MQVDASSAQLAHDQAAIDYCFKPALDYKAAGMSASQAVLRVLTTLKEVADNAQVSSVLGNGQGLLDFSPNCQCLVVQYLNIVAQRKDIMLAFLLVA